jgi:selenocysteine lyase/cysteine desulfurase
LSILTALKFRKQYGEDAIISYTHSLAIEGGKAMAKILGTHTLTRDDDDKVANMVNVALPIKDLKHPKANNADFMKIMLDKYNLYTPAFIHGDHLYTRVSAQIYLELEDFVRLANIWKEVIEGLNASS